MREMYYSCLVLSHQTAWRVSKVANLTTLQTLSQVKETCNYNFFSPKEGWPFVIGPSRPQKMKPPLRLLETSTPVRHFFHPSLQTVSGGSSELTTLTKLFFILQLLYYFSSSFISRRKLFLYLVVGEKGVDLGLIL